MTTVPLLHLPGVLLGVLLGVLDMLRDRLPDFPGERALVLAEADPDELAFRCHLAIGAFVMGMSSFRRLCTSFSNMKWAILLSSRQPLIESRQAGINQLD